MTLQQHHLWADSSGWWCVCLYVSVCLATTGGLRNRHNNGRYDRDLWLGKHTYTNMSTCTFLTQMLSPGSPGRFGNHSELCSQGSSSLYPSVFVKVLLNKSIRTRRHRVWLPSVGAQMAWPGFQTYAHIMIGLYRYRWSKPSRGLGWFGLGDCLEWTKQVRGGRSMERNCQERRLSHGGRNTARQTDSFNQQKPKIPPSRK